METFFHKKKKYRIQNPELYGSDYKEWEVYDVENKKVVGYYPDGGMRIDVVDIKDYLS